MSLNQDFINKQEDFLKTYVIVVPEETDKMCQHPGVYHFNLELAPGKPNNLVLLINIAIPKVDCITAYYLPWEKNKAPKMVLDSGAKYFFTSEMTNCRFTIVIDDPKRPLVAHVAGNTNKTDRNAWEKRDGVLNKAGQHTGRRFSTSGSVGQKKVHEYGGGFYSSAFLFGQVNGKGEWGFFAQINEGDLSGWKNLNKFTNKTPKFDIMSLAEQTIK